MILSPPIPPVPAGTPGTPEWARAELARAEPDMQAAIRELIAIPMRHNRSIEFAKMCHLYKWSRSRATFVWDIACILVRKPIVPGLTAHPYADDVDDDIPF